jgi:RNA polymerase sigma-70 factor (ECF subfamily)
MADNNRKMIDRNNDIAARCMEGDKRAQMQLYQTFYKRIYNSCFRILKDRCEAEDAMQESFLKAFSKLDKYDTQIPFEAWIVRIAVNTSIDKLRKNRPEFVDFNENALPDGIDDDNDEMEFNEGRIQQIRAAIEHLPDSDRLIVSLYLMEGYDHEEIADILNIRHGTVRVQYMRAKRKMMKFIKNNGK